MSSINDIIKSAVNNVQKSQKNFDVEEWARQKKHDREYAYQLQDDMAKMIAEYGGKYKLYLDVQSKFPNYSVGNALLVMAQNPQATELRDSESWKKDKIFFKGNPEKIIILEPSNVYTREDGTEVQGYDAKRVYDISDMNVKRKINSVPYTQESVLKGILSMSPVKIEVVEDTFDKKLVSFNASKRIIEVLDRAEVPDIIQGLTREIASIHLNTFANTELNNFKNKSVAYMISKKYSIPTDSINIDKIPNELREMTPQEIKSELSGMSECYQILAEGIDRTLDIEPKAKNHREYER